MTASAFARAGAGSRALYVLFSALALGAMAGPSTRTIDDQKGDSVTGVLPVYQPTDGWKFGPTCIACFVKLDASKAFDQSWHDATAAAGDVRNITLSFTGTAVQVFGIVPNLVLDATTIVNVTFNLDGTPGTPFFHAPDVTNNFLFNASVFSRQGLANVPHKLVITPTGGTASSLFLFDYATYTFDDTPSSSSQPSSSTPGSTKSSSTSSANPSARPHKPSPPITAIIGALIGVLALISLALLGVFCWRRRKHDSQDRIRNVQGRSILDPETPSDLRRPPVVIAGPGRSSLLAGATPFIPSSPRLLSQKAATALAYAERQRRPPAPENGEDSRKPSVTESGESSSGGRPSLYPPSLPPTGEAAQSPAERALQGRVKALEAEVHYLRAHDVVVPPPAYAGGSPPAPVRPEKGRRGPFIVNNPGQ